MKKLFSGISLCLSILLAAGVKLLFHACKAKEDGSWMHCHQAENAVMICGIILAVLSVIGILIQNRKTLVLIHLLTAMLATVTALIPNTIVHLCMKMDMRCHSVMKPAVIIICACIAVSSMILCFARRKLQ